MPSFQGLAASAWPYKWVFGCVIQFVVIAVMYFLISGFPMGSGVSTQGLIIWLLVFLEKRKVGAGKCVGITILRRMVGSLFD